LSPLISESFASRLLSENLKIETHKANILPGVLYGCKTWSLTLREHKLRTFLEQSVEKTTLICKRRNNRRIEKTAKWGAS
jgi:hypothetical protein